MNRTLAIVLSMLGGVVLVAPIVAILALIFFEDRDVDVAEITIVNASSELVVNGAVEALGTAYPFSSLATGQTAKISFPIAGDGGYRVRAQLESGRTVDSGEERNLVPGFGVEDRADVTNDGINIRAIMPFRVKLILKDGSETFTPEIANQPLPNRMETIDVAIEGRTVRAVAHLLEWTTPAETDGVPAPIVTAVEAE